MPCRHYTIDGRHVIICSRGRGRRAPPAPCSVCRAPSTKLCDYPTLENASGTCDRPLCDEHAVHVGPDRDYCVIHPPLLRRV